MSEVGGDDVGAPSDSFDLFGDLFELRLRSRRYDHVRTGFGECERHRRTQPATGSCDDRDLVVQPESVEYHVCLSFVAGRYRNKVAAAICGISETRSSSVSVRLHPVPVRRPVESAVARYFSRSAAALEASIR
jgi:hypothetical protein